MHKLLKESFCFVVFFNCLANFLFAETNPNKAGLPKEIRASKDFIEWAKKWQKIKPDFSVAKFKYDGESQIFNNEKIETINENSLERVKEEIEITKSVFKVNLSKIESPDKRKFVNICSGGEPDISVFIFNLSSNTYQEIVNGGSGVHCYNAIWIDNNRFMLIHNNVYDDVSVAIEFYDLNKNMVTRYSYSEAISKNDYRKYRSRYIFK